ncbi:nuclear transport factor 2 family protein [Streptomyces rugosispiralis]|uniref:Nuclear transport factor 2 family protein n=1 Tax=Streptomyces rugosispiralis TaxID=2967341 RepID=A0ABT1UYS3_9ACTN|nr:nuclear transport factor 2 family protein [Streptomyces rugosispiralis]MCQ8190272.1 nuclear transport factor 2 family protein [Streptomyces rugosispiralis]
MTDPGPFPAEAAVDRYFAAVAARDAAAWAANFAAEGSSEDPVGGEPAIGREALRAFQQSIFDAFPVMVLTPRARYFGANQAAVTWTCHVETDGRAADFDGVNTYEVDEEGRITRQKAFWDMAGVQRRLARD